MNICKGNGFCLQQDEHQYSKNPDIKCDHSCVPIKCKNYILCSAQFPEMYIDCWGGEGLCYSCLTSFGTCEKMPNGNIVKIGKGILETTNMCCPVCNEIKICISQPYCNHSLCVECFKECYGDNWEYDVEDPQFPYSEDIKREWMEDVSGDNEIEKFVNKYPLMKKYRDEDDKWYDNKIEAWRKIKHLFHVCPICKITKEIKYNQILENKNILKNYFNIFKKNWLMKKYNDSDDDTIINKYEFYGIINQDVECCIKSCQKSMSKCNFGYIKHQLYFCEKPDVLCPDCFNKKDDNSDFIPRQYKHLPKNTWNPPWIKVMIDI